MTLKQISLKSFLDAAGDKLKNGVIFTHPASPVLPLMVEVFQDAVRRIQEAVENPCTTNPCNNGICEARNTTTYACYCPDGYAMGSSDPFTCVAA